MDTRERESFQKALQEANLKVVKLHAEKQHILDTATKNVKRVADEIDSLIKKLDEMDANLEKIDMMLQSFFEGHSNLKFVLNEIRSMRLARIK